MKKAIATIITCLLFFNSTYSIQADEHISQSKYTNYDLLKAAAQCYGTYLAGSLAHEFGHWIVGKKIHNCNGIFWITPLGTGTNFNYYNPTKEILKALWNNDRHYPIKHVLKNPIVSSAGPLFGIGFSLLAPLVNTFYHEYKQEKTMLPAFRKTTEQCYINEKQNIGLIAGAQFLLLGNLLNLSPFVAGSDGNNIAKYFKFVISHSRVTRIGAAITAAALVSPLYIKTVHTLFDDNV